jgi:hypothetical protein
MTLSKNKPGVLTAFVLLVVALTLAACASGGPEQAVQGYFEALIEGDEATARALSCAEWEATAATRVSTFAALDARLEDVTCTADGEGDGYTRVTCTGQIVITYGTEDQEIPLTSYRAVREGGEWLMCGEAE